MITVVLVIHLLICIAMVAVILLQRSEGGALGIGGGGGGGGGGVMGGLMTGRAAGNVLTKATGFLAAGFFVTSLTLALLADSGQRGSLMDEGPAPAAGETAPQPGVPAAPESAPGGTGDNGEPAAPVAQ